MKIIIAYASAGTGHKRAAESIYDYFKEHCPNLELSLIDVLEKTNPFFRSSYIFGYYFLVRHAIYLWRLCFWWTEAEYLRSFNRILTFLIHRLNTLKFSQFLIQENPDIIISTHFLPSEVSNYLKRSGKISPRTVTVITDFGVHPAWVSSGTDLYVAASDFTKERLLLYGIDEGKIKVLGIPVEEKFFKEYDKNELCEKLDIKRNKFTVLIVTGSFGIGPIEYIVNLLCQNVQILVVCAKNKKLYKRLKHKNYPDVKVYGFVDNLAELMCICDVVITKPGGIGISEILASQTPPIFISPIPGQESENIKALERYKIGLYPRNLKEIRDIILDYQEYPQKLEMGKGDIRLIRKPFATQELCRVLCAGSLRHTG